jgi:CRISPR-associated protein Cas2
MFAILIYDISTDKDKEKRNYRKIVKTIENYLQRVQFSVFEGEIQPHLLIELKSKLKKLVDKDFDSIIVYEFKNRAYSNKIEIGIKNEHPMFS